MLSVYRSHQKIRVVILLLFPDVCSTQQMRRELFLVETHYWKPGTMEAMLSFILKSVRPKCRIQVSANGLYFFGVGLQRSVVVPSHQGTLQLIFLCLTLFCLDRLNFVMLYFAYKESRGRFISELFEDKIIKYWCYYDCFLHV